MTVGELIKILGSVSPGVEVRVATDEGVKSIEEVRTLGWSGAVNIVTE